MRDLTGVEDLELAGRRIDDPNAKHWTNQTNEIARLHVLVEKLKGELRTARTSARDARSRAKDAERALDEARRRERAVDHVSYLANSNQLASQTKSLREQLALVDHLRGLLATSETRCANQAATIEALQASLGGDLKPGSA